MNFAVWKNVSTNILNLGQKNKNKEKIKKKNILSN
jgi:hypothetical protein